MKAPKWLLIGIVISLLVVAVLPACSSQGVCPPPGDFPDYETLASWVESHAQPFEIGSGVEAWYAAALAVQREAANDGYLVSAILMESPYMAGEYIVRCTALAEGDLYWWHPEDTECTLMFTREELRL